MLYINSQFSANVTTNFENWDTDNKPIYCVYIKQNSKKQLFWGYSRNASPEAGVILVVSE